MDIEKVKRAIEVYYKTVEAHAKAEQNVQSALQQLKDLAGSPTFTLDAQFYQVREREGKKYLCVLKEKPKGRPKKKAVAEPVVVESLEPTETTVKDNVE